MGLTAVDLPDSADQSPPPIVSADDLLSQLAGEEIDRMLAEVEEKDGPSVNAELEPEEAAALEGEPAPDLVVLEPPPAEITPGLAPAQDAYEAEVEQLFKEIESIPSREQPAPVEQQIAPAVEPPEPAPAAEANIEPAPVSPDPEPQAPAPALESPIEPEQPTSAAEKTALAPPEPTDVRAAIDSAMKQVRLERAPLMVRILEIVNLPLASCPDVVRDLLGKVAILTLMNSVGVLLYLFLFRK